MQDTTQQPVTVIGREVQSGAYLLRIHVAEPLALTFGRFRDGEPLPFPPGDYLYAGSAMGLKGATSLARRLVRHATRSGRRAPHPIREQMLATFATVGLGRGDLRPRRPKSLFWHVDYLLDPPAVSLTHVLAIRSPQRLEEDLAALAAAQCYTYVPARGLGASDTPGSTHLFSIQSRPGWWPKLLRRVQAHIL